MEIQTKIHKCNLIKLKSFCTAKETINKMKTTYGLGENICKQCYQQGINFQNIQTVHTAEYQRNSPVKKGQKTYIDITPKKIYRWPTDI